MDLLEKPLTTWSQEISDEDSEQLWIRLADALLGDLTFEHVYVLLQHGIERNDPAHSERVTSLRVAQRYWGVCVAAGASIGAVTTWAGSADSRETMRLLSECVEKLPQMLLIDLASHRQTRAAERLEAALRELPERESGILRKRYGLGTPRETLEIIGRSFDLTRERIRQIEKRAQEKLPPDVAAELGSLTDNNRLSAVAEAFSVLSSGLGEDVHTFDEVKKVVRQNPAWWAGGFASLADGIGQIGLESESKSIRKWLIAGGVVWLDEHEQRFLKCWSGSHNHYVNLMLKLFAVSQRVPVGVAYQALVHTWRSGTWSRLAISESEFEFAMRGMSFQVEAGVVIDSRDSASPDVLNSSEQEILGALRQLDGLGTLEQLREKLPELLWPGSTLSQTFYRRTPIVERLAPSVFGLRGTTHDPDRLAALNQSIASTGRRRRPSATSAPHGWPASSSKPCQDPQATSGP